MHQSRHVQQFSITESGLWGVAARNLLKSVALSPLHAECLNLANAGPNGASRIHPSVTRTSFYVTRIQWGRRRYPNRTRNNYRQTWRALRGANDLQQDLYTPHLSRQTLILLKALAKIQHNTLDTITESSSGPGCN